MKLTEEQIARVKSLENDRGEITPDIVLADAKQKDSPLHALIDWDKNKSAHAWWLQCAREIIGAVKVHITITHSTVKAPAYIRDPDAVGQGYRSVVALVGDPSSARQALIDELKRAEGNVIRARSIAVALNLEDECDQILDKMIGLQHRVEAEGVAPEERRAS